MHIFKKTDTYINILKNRYPFYFKTKLDICYKDNNVDIMLINNVNSNPLSKTTLYSTITEKSNDNISSLFILLMTI